MIRVQGLLKDFTPIEAVGKSGKVWHLRWDCQPIILTDENGNKEETGLAVWAEEMFYGVPTAEAVRRIIYKYYNDITDNKILSGFVWKEMAVWLSTENQFNYKAAYDMAVQTGGSSLPCAFKFGTTEVPVYYTFETLDDLTDFYTQSLAYVQQCLSDGWATKGAIDFSVYEKEVTDGND